MKPCSFITTEIPKCQAVKVCQLHQRTKMITKMFLYPYLVTDIMFREYFSNTIRAKKDQPSKQMLNGSILVVIYKESDTFRHHRMVSAYIDIHGMHAML